MPNNQSRLPPTHYDGLLKTDPELFASVKKDLQRGIDGPVSSVDELPNFIPYAEREMDLFMEDVADSLKNVLGYKPQGQELNSLASQHINLYQVGQSFAFNYQCVFNFERFDRKTFYLTDAIVERLLVTDLDAPSEYLHLPFPSCMFVMNSALAREALSGLFKAESERSDAPITIYAYETAYRGLRKMVFAVFQSKGGDVHSFAKRELLIHPDWRIEDSLKTDWDQLYDKYPDWEAGAGVDSIGDLLDEQASESVFYTSGLSFFRLLVNAILYLASNDPDVKAMASPRSDLEKMLDNASSRAKKKKLRNAIGKVSHLDGSVVGSALQPINVHKVDAVPSDAHGSTVTLTKRFLVRGHWRNQAHGAGLKQRKLMYIQPHFKGPEVGEVRNKPYVVR